MGSSSGHDLFEGFNGREVSEVLRRCTNCGRLVLIGPPRSGKTFFKEKYLKGVTVVEHTLGVTTTAKTEGEEAEGESGLGKKVMTILKRMIPIIGNFADKERVDDEELRRVLGDWAPKHVVEWAEKVIGDSPHRAYYIPWECVEEPNECTSDQDASKALELIKEVFDDKKVRIRWFKAEYIPPGLVEEVIELVREKGEDGARKVLKGWVDAYFKAVGTLREVLGLKENLLEWDELSIGYLNSLVNNYANYVIAGLAVAPILGAAFQALISVLTYLAFKKEGMNYLQEIVELWRGLNGLSVKGPDGRLDFNELGRLLVHRVAYAMGMSYDEAKEALMGITGLSVKDLEERVKEIERKIEELEKKFESFRHEVRAGIVTADVGEFAKGGIYLNIEVEDDGLRICAEGRCYNIVRAGRFNELVGEIKDKLLKHGFVVVVGPKGIGKSTLTAAVIWELLVNGDVGRVARVDVLNEENYQGFERFLRNYSRELTNYLGRLLILYDPVSTETYEREPSTQQGQGVLAGSCGSVRRVRYVKIPRNVEVTIANLINASSELGDLRLPILVVLPSDVYNALSEEMRNELKGYRLDVSQDLANTEFLAELIREYTRTKSNPNGCALSDRELSELAGELAKFDSGHALIARLIGEELARNNCSAREIKELISKAKGKAEAFIILHINGLFKVHEDSKIAEALVEIFALRRPFIDSVRPGDPILTPGIIELIGEKKGASLLQSAEGKELRNWLALRQHDLIEEAIEKLLKCIVSEGEECKDLGDASDPWKTNGVGMGVMKSLMEVSEKVRDVSTAVEYFVGNYGKDFTDALKVFSNKCWKRAALIIGHALAGDLIAPWLKYLSVFPPETLSKSLVESVIEFLSGLGLGVDSDEIPPLTMSLTKHFASVVETLGDALKECDVDVYLLVGDKIPPLIRYLTYTRISTEAFINKYNEAIAEIRRVLNIAGKRDSIYDAEGFYGLGLASIIAKAVESGEPIEPSDANATLHIVSLTIQHNTILSLSSIAEPLLSSLVPLRDKAPQRYLEVLASALDEVSAPDILRGSMCPDLNPIMYILNEFNYILNKYRDKVKGHAWTLVRAINASINSLYKCLMHCDDYRNTSFRRELERIASRVAGLLNELDRLNPSLGIIAWAQALLPALDNECVRALMGSVLGIDVVNKKAKEVARELSKLSVQELVRSKDFMGFVDSWLAETDEDAARREILEETSNLKNAWAQHKLDDDELYEAKELFNGAAEESREVSDYDYLNNRDWVLRVEAIKGKLAGDELVNLVDEFRQLYEEAKKYLTSESPDSDIPMIEDDLVPRILGGYLVSLALKGGDEEIRRIEESLKEQWLMYTPNMEVLILTRLTLNALLSPRNELSGELKGKLSVNPEELIDAFIFEMYSKYLPALRVAFGIVKPEKGYKECMSTEDSTERRDCEGAVSALMDDSYAVELIRWKLIYNFDGQILENERSGWLRELGFDANALISKFKKLVSGLDGRSLVQLIAPGSLRAQLALMLHALINGNKELAKAHALYGAASTAGKLPAKLFLEAYRACCDLDSESFRCAIARLFFLHND